MSRHSCTVRPPVSQACLTRDSAWSPTGVRTRPGAGSGHGARARLTGTGADPQDGPTATSTDAAPASGIQPASPVVVWSAMWIAYVVWGSTYLAIAVAIESMPPLIAPGTRFLAAAAVLPVVLAVRHGPRSLLVAWPRLRGAMVVGALLLGIGVLTLAERSVPSGVAALIVAITPLWVVLLRAATGDRPPLGAWIGVGILGVGVVVAPGAPGSGDACTQRTLWSLAMLLGAACWALGSFLQPKIRATRSCSPSTRCSPAG